MSSNAAAVRLTEHVGRSEVFRAARDLGLASPLDEGPAATLGTSEVSLLEMTAAYAAVAAGRYPVRGARTAGGGDRRAHRGNSGPAAHLADAVGVALDLGQ